MKFPSLMRRTLAALVVVACLGATVQAVEPYKNTSGKIRTYRAKEDFSWEKQKLERPDSTKVSPYKKSVRDYPAPYGRSRYSGNRAPRR